MFFSFKTYATTFLVGFFLVLGGCSQSRTANSPTDKRVRLLIEPTNRPLDVSGKFTAMDPADTGLNFAPEVDPDHRLARLYHSVFAANGIAIGDVDGDDVPDVFVVGGRQPNQLFRQTSAFKFVDVTDAAGFTSSDHSWSVSASLVDVDNDNDLDVYVCNYESPNELWINDGTGKFVERAHEYGVDISDSSVMGYFGDFDNDGFVDLYLLTNRLYYEGGLVTKLQAKRLANGQLEVDGELAKYFRFVPKPGGEFAVTQRGRKDWLFHNSGGRKFVDQTDASGIAGESHGLSAVLWDYDDDNDLDIYVCNDFTDPDCLYENQGEGKFKDVIKDVFRHTSWFSMGSDIADVNNDGLPDLVTVDMSGSTHYLSKILMGDMSTFQHFLDAEEPRQYMRNFLHVNAGKIASTTAGPNRPGFLETARMSKIASTDWSWGPVLADFDNDGFCDLFVTNGHIRNFNDPDVLGKRPKDQVNNSTLWEIFKNEKPMPQVNAAFRNTDGIHFESHATEWGLDHLGISYASATGDLDRDGDLDLIVMNLNEPISVYRNDVSNNNSLTVRLIGSSSNRGGLGAKVRVDTEDSTQLKELTPYRGFLASHEPILQFGVGQHEKIDRLTVTWPSGIVQQLTNVDANQLLTIREPEAAPSFASSQPQPLFARLDSNLAARRETPFDDFETQPLLPNKLSQLGPGVAVADVDSDGNDDLYVSSPAGQEKGFGLRTTGDSSSEKLSFKTVSLPVDLRKEEFTPLFFDADGDGDLDVYVVNGGVESKNRAERLSDSLAVNTNNRGFVLADSSALPGTAFSGGAAAVADYDRDGDLDIFVGGRVVAGQYPTPPRSMLLRNETTEADHPVFVDATETDADHLLRAGMITSALWSDVNSDGWIDLLLTTEWGPIQVFLNSQGRLVDSTEQSGLASHLGWWNGITGRDLDNDGDIDYVATNFGLNTKYSASAKKPDRIYYGTFGDSDRPQIIEAKVAEDCELPVRGKSCSQNAMPFIRDKFPTYHEFASSELYDIYSKSELDSATKFEVNELCTCLLINDGGGRFEFQPLPWLAQVAPGFGVAATDVNSDGWTDLYIAQNFFTPQRETGRMAGGLGALLLGSPTGKFNQIWPSASGLAISADAKGLAISDLNGDRRPDFVVGINDERLRFFENHCADNVPIKIHLRGDKNNLQAIGSRVEVVLAGGSKQTAEVSVGGSYLSQSTCDLFFGMDKSDRIQMIRVIWPDGSKSEVVPQEIQSTIEIQK